MKINPLLMDIYRGEWLMSFQGLQAYAPLAYKILSGETITLQNNPHKLVNIFDHTGSAVNSDEDGKLVIPKNSIAVINMIGPAIKYGDWCTYGADEIANALFYANNNPNIKAIIFNIDGPGGSGSAIGPLLSFAPHKKKPVIGLIDQCCSLHYWALCAVADYKIALNSVTPLIGSVGVVMTFVDNKEYLEKLGYKIHEIYPPESKHKNEAYRLALEGKYEKITEEILSPMAKNFQAAVRKACPNLKEETGVLTGRTFFAEQAKDLGMIDAIGGFDMALSMIPVVQELKYSK